MSLRRIRDQVVSDALAGLANRAGLDEALDRITKRGEPLRAAPAAAGPRRVKLVKDAYGRAAGDAFLTHVGHQLRSVVRGRNVTARIGGDEFAIRRSAPMATLRRAATTWGPVPVRIWERPVGFWVGVDELLSLSSM